MTAEWDELGRETRYEYHPGLHLVSRRINPDGSELNYRYDNAKLFLSEIENEHGEQSTAFTISPMAWSRGKPALMATPPLTATISMVT
ncbi:hypothetical protein [Aeromonas allosaccharophila]